MSCPASYLSLSPNKPKRSWGDVRERGRICFCGLLVTRSHGLLSFLLLYFTNVYEYYGNFGILSKLAAQ